MLYPFNSQWFYIFWSLVLRKYVMKFLLGGGDIDRGNRLKWPGQSLFA